MTKKLLRSKRVKTQKFRPQIMEKNKLLIKTYGLNSVSELDRTRYELNRYRNFFRNHERKDPKYQKVLDRLCRLGIITEEMRELKISLTLESFLERRLATLASKRFSLPIKQIRQYIVQGLIRVNKKIKTSPSFLVRVESEPLITMDTFRNSKTSSSK